ncbi:MAG: ROK family protein [Clostridiales bacterium]|nr:ROK family protein [Clostridiales bacterium]
MGTTKEKKAAMPADAKKVNRQRILQSLRSGRIMTAADVSKETGISRPTAMRTLQYFCEKGVACSLGLGESTLAGGKKPELFCFAEERKILCVNLWPREICLGVCGMIGDMEHVRLYPVGSQISLDDTFAALGNIALEYLKGLGLSLEALYGVMLSISGTVDDDKKLLRYNVKAPGWGTNAELLGRLKGIFGEKKEYFVTNAGKAAGRAVLLDQPAYADQRIMTVFTTWGICACLMDRGRVLDGRDALIGEIGHMVISDKADSSCTCGKKGCLESMVRLSRVCAMLEDEGEGEGAKELTFLRLFELSASGHGGAQRVVRYLAHCFSVALHNLSLAYNQETVIFQGDFAWADSLFDRCLKEELAEFCYYPGGEAFEIVYDRQDLMLASLRGGAQVLREKYFAAVE